MYNIVIFSGGTGSIALQEGFSAIYGNENYNLDIIINAYDNGRSTGVCRRIFDSKILGPSDLRKNHMTQFKIQHAGKLEDTASRESVIYRLFSQRIDAGSKEECHRIACCLLDDAADTVESKDIACLRELLEFFFFGNTGDGTWRETLQGVDFKDFSLANIFYSAAAAKNDNSLQKAGIKMAEILQIKQNVHLISNVNLFLQAKTESGHMITDEGDIVEWDNPDDRIVSVTLTKDGEEYIPSVDEEKDLSRSCSTRELVEAADIIIFSSGTQWSSLIPSYMHSGLRKILAASGAKKYVVMNNIEDHDMKGVTADDIIGILGRYIPMDDVTSVVNLDAVPGMNHVSKGRCICGHIGGNGEDRHNPVGLVHLIMNDFLELPGKNVTYIYDLDGTLWDERATNQGKAVGTENMNLFDGILHSGNSYKHVRDTFKYLYHQDKVVQIYSDFGNIHFTSEDYRLSLLSEKYVIDASVAEELEKDEAFQGKVSVRGEGCVITIKPLVNREVLLQRVQERLSLYKGLYVAYISGHTSIDVMRKDYNKKTMLCEILKKERLARTEVVFVGNETDEGAEADIGGLGVRTIQVDDVYECNVLLRTIKAGKNQNVSE